MFCGSVSNSDRNASRGQQTLILRKRERTKMPGEIVHGSRD
jgi:hypothetical protein